MLTIRLTRIGKRNQPQYRLVLTDHTFPVRGKFIEILGDFDPKSGQLNLKKERVEYWLKNGSKVSQTAKELLKKQKVTGNMDVINYKDRPAMKKKGEQGKEAVAPAAGQTEAKPEEKKEEPKAETKPEAPKEPEQAK